MMVLINTAYHVKQHNEQKVVDKVAELLKLPEDYRLILGQDLDLQEFQDDSYLLTIPVMVLIKREQAMELIEIGREPNHDE